mgnify:CR=1 FL=1
MSAKSNKKPSFALGLALILALLTAVILGGMWIVQAAYAPRMSDAAAAAAQAASARWGRNTHWLRRSAAS